MKLAPFIGTSPTTRPSKVLEGGINRSIFFEGVLFTAGQGVHFTTGVHHLTQHRHHGHFWIMALIAAAKYLNFYKLSPVILQLFVITYK